MSAVHKGEIMKSSITLAVFIGLTALTSISHASGKFCMKKYLASLSLHPNAATNFYAQTAKNTTGNSNDATTSVGRHR